ncbi:MAG: AraC family transcriptional regulator [Clostridiales bacterium]|nr:AraC family transcriptional regulator [Clostridiales bacterium]
MSAKEFEFIDYTVLRDVKLFFVDIVHRSMHMHKEFELFYIFSGTMHLHCGHEVHRVQPGEFILFNPRVMHEFRAASDKSVRILPLQVSPSFWVRFYPQISNVEFDAIRINEHLGERLQELLHHYTQAALSYMQKQPYHELRCAAEVNRVMQILLETLPWHYLTEKEKELKRGFSTRFARIMKYIEEHYTGKLLLSDLCQQEGLSLSYLSRFFTRHLGLSFQEYVTRLRFERAKFLLERSDMKLTDIAYSSGFSDIRYMNKVFLEVYGYPAEAYRQNCPLQEDISFDDGSAGDSVQSFPDEAQSLSYLNTWMASQDFQLS